MTKNESPPSGAPTADAKRLWNSLEIAKLIMSAATPLALFGIGYIVTQQSTDDANKRAEATEASRNAYQAQIRGEDAKLARETKAAEDKAGAQVRDQSFQREQKLLAEQFAHDADVRDKAYQREAAVRRDALELERSSKLIALRTQFWEKLSPKLSKIAQLADEALLSGNSVAELDDTFRDCEELFAIYRPYFSPRFEAQYTEYKKSVRRVLDIATNPHVMRGMLVGDAARPMCLNYDKLRDLAASEVAEATGLVPTRQASTANTEQVAECEHRAELMYRQALAKPTAVH